MFKSKHVKKKVKDFIRSKIEVIPFNLGKKTINLYRSSLGMKKKNYFERKERTRLLDRLEKGNLERINVVYDYLSSPPTLGDFFYTVMLARYFTTLGVETRFIIIEDEYREDWKNFSLKEKKNRTAMHLKLAEMLLNPKFSSVLLRTWHDFSENLLEKLNHKEDIIFRNEIRSRSPLYSHSLNLINLLCEKNNDLFLKQFFLNEDIFFCEMPYKKIENPYITYHCRRSEKTTSQFRNTQAHEFIEINERLNELYPNYKVLILSDEVGYRYFKKLAYEHGVDCIFSKDYSDSFFGDCGLLLGSSFHFSLRGGGIDSLIFFSDCPYEEYASPINESLYGIRKATSWAKYNQLYHDIEGSAETFLPSGDIVLGL